VKKICSLLLITLLTTNVYAGFTGPSAAGEAGVSNTTVAQVKTVRAGSYVTLTGYILNHKSKNYFMFSDGTGEIRIEVDGSVWSGQQVSPKTKVRLLGEVERGSSGRHIWVKSLTIVD
jgi:uncharacterized protein (TIGR00156 family)